MFVLVPYPAEIRTNDAVIDCCDIEKSKYIYENKSLRGNADEINVNVSGTGPQQHEPDQKYTEHKNKYQTKQSTGTIDARRSERPNGGTTYQCGLNQEGTKSCCTDQAIQYKREGFTGRRMAVGRRKQRENEGLKAK